MIQTAVRSHEIVGPPQAGSGADTPATFLIDRFQIERGRFFLHNPNDPKQRPSVPAVDMAGGVIFATSSDPSVLRIRYETNPNFLDPKDVARELFWACLNGLYQARPDDELEAFRHTATPHALQQVGPDSIVAALVLTKKEEVRQSYDTRLCLSRGLHTAFAERAWQLNAQRNQIFRENRQPDPELATLCRELPALTSGNKRQHNNLARVVIGSFATALPSPQQLAQELGLQLDTAELKEVVERATSSQPAFA